VDGNLDGALKRLKRRFGDDIAPALKRHEAFLSPSERRRTKQRAARNRAARLARKQTAREHEE
jgi:ribosomal protein S21